MTEFKKQYQNEPVDFHLWSQDKRCFNIVQNKIDEELEE